MTPRPAEPAPAPTQTICPHLGTDTDRATACLFVTDAHYCYRFEPAARAPADFQSAYCLSGAYEQCANYQAATPAQRVLAPAGRRGLPRLLSTVGGGALIGAMVGAAALLGVAVAVLQREDGPTGSSGATTVEEPPVTVAAVVATSAGGTPLPSAPPETATASATATVNATATASATATPSPATPTQAAATATATAQPATATPASATATPPPTATAQAQATSPAGGTPALTVRERYRVKPGDSLSAIAEYYGARLEDMLRLNGLTLNSVIYNGQELLIP